MQTLTVPDRARNQPFKPGTVKEIHIGSQETREPTVQVPDRAPLLVPRLQPGTIMQNNLRKCQYQNYQMNIMVKHIF